MDGRYIFLSVNQSITHWSIYPFINQLEILYKRVCTYVEKLLSVQESILILIL